MASDLPNITGAELKILKLIWQLGPSTVRAVKDAMEASLGEKAAYTTVMTLMNQLGTKGALAVDRSRQPFVYSAAVRRDQVLGARLKQFLNSVFDGQAGELVLRLVEDAELSTEDLQRIEAKIEQAEQGEQEAEQ